MRRGIYIKCTSIRIYVYKANTYKESHTQEQIEQTVFLQFKLYMSCRSVKPSKVVSNQNVSDLISYFRITFEIKIGWSSQFDACHFVCGHY